MRIVVGFALGSTIMEPGAVPGLNLRRELLGLVGFRPMLSLFDFNGLESLDWLCSNADAGHTSRNVFAVGS